MLKMCKSIAFIVITFLALSFNYQTHGTTVSSTGNRVLGCRAFNGSLSIPIGSAFLTLNQTNFEVTLSRMPRSCIYLFVATNIEIQLGDVINNPVNINDYLISYRLNTNLYSISLSELNVSTTRTDKTTNVTINRILFEEITIARFINTRDNFRVRYVIRGFTTPRVTVSSYLIQQPNLVLSGGVINIDDTYNGMCNGEVCYGGRGQLMDGVIGGQSDTSANEVNVGWRCFAPSTNCTFPLRIILSGQAMVSNLILYGYNTSDVNVPPKITLTQSSTIANFPILRRTTDNTYSVDIPINRFTDEIIVDMNILVGQVLVLSEVQVISNDVNIALLAIEYSRSSIFPPSNDNTGTPTQSVTKPYPITTFPMQASFSPTFVQNIQSTSNTNPPSINPTIFRTDTLATGHVSETSRNPIITPTPTLSPNTAALASRLNNVSFIIFPLIIAAILLMLLVAIVCCIILFIKYRNVKNQLTKSPTNNMLVQLSGTHAANEERSRYSSRIPNHDTLYATIGPEAALDPKTNPETLETDFNKNRTGTYVRNEELFDNPIYVGDGVMLPATETSDTKCQQQSPLKPPVGHFNRNFQLDNNTAPSNGKSFGKEGEISSISEGTQNNGINENPLYKDTRLDASYTQLVINGEQPTEKNQEGFPSYDYLKH